MIGGHNTGPETDGHITVFYGSIAGYGIEAIDDDRDRYTNVARIMFKAAKEYFDDVRSARLVRGVRGSRQ